MPLVVSQDKHRPIGEIDFYGYGGLDLNKIRTALTLREGDQLSDSDDAVVEAIGHIKDAVKRTVGKSPTDVAAVCCDAQGRAMFYIGLPGSSMRTVPYNPPPRSPVHLPARIVTLYEETMDASSKEVRSGSAKEDDSMGYALSAAPDLRAKQLAARSYALRHERLVLRVLASAQDAAQRIAAAHILGYARQSAQQIKALVTASYDPDETVRNNTIRALG